jgi:hypothetical protein
LLAAYLVLVGIPVLGLLGILQAGRRVHAPLSIGGDWTVEFAAAEGCANGPAGLRQPALNISQSGTEALITLNDGHATTMEATVDNATLAAKSLTATISGRPGERTLAGQMNLKGCAPVAFRAVRQTPKKGGG